MAKNKITNLPGINSNEVIPSNPQMVKENHLDKLYDFVTNFVKICDILKQKIYVK